MVLKHLLGVLEAIATAIRGIHAAERKVATSLAGRFSITFYFTSLALVAAEISPMSWRGPPGRYPEPLPCNRCVAITF